MEGSKPLERRVMTDEEKGSYEYRLKLERDRDRSHRESERGMFNASMLSLDDSTTRGTNNENSPAWDSDHGYGARQIIRAGMKELIDSTISQLPKPYRDFARAILDGKGYEDLGMPKSTFYWKIEKVCFSIGHLPPKRQV